MKLKMFIRTIYKEKLCIMLIYPFVKVYQVKLLNGLEDLVTMVKLNLGDNYIFD